MGKLIKNLTIDFSERYKIPYKAASYITVRLINKQPPEYIKTRLKEKFIKTKRQLEIATKKKCPTLKQLQEGLNRRLFLIQFLDKNPDIKL